MLKYFLAMFFFLASCAVSFDDNANVKDDSNQPSVPSDGAMGNDGSENAPGEATPREPYWPNPVWPVNDRLPWQWGRPIPVSSTEGARVAIGEPLVLERAAYFPMRLGSGSLVVDGEVLQNDEDFSKAAIVYSQVDHDRVRGHRISRVKYVDSFLDHPELPQLSACGGRIYALINSEQQQDSILLEFSSDLKESKQARFSALAAIGSRIYLSELSCVGSRIVFLVDATGGFLFRSDRGDRLTMSAEKADGKSLIIDGEFLFAEEASFRTVSVASMKLSKLTPQKGKDALLYVGEALEARQSAGGPKLEVGDKVIYRRDFSQGEGGSLVSQVFGPKDEIIQLESFLSGEIVLLSSTYDEDEDAYFDTASLLDADGKRLWSASSSLWTLERASMGRNGELLLSGRYIYQHPLWDGGPLEAGQSKFFLIGIEPQSGEPYGFLDAPGDRLLAGPVTAWGEACGHRSSAILLENKGEIQWHGLYGIDRAFYRLCRSVPLAVSPGSMRWIPAEQPSDAPFTGWVIARELGQDVLFQDTLLWPSGSLQFGPVIGDLVEPVETEAFFEGEEANLP